MGPRSLQSTAVDGCTYVLRYLTQFIKSIASFSGDLSKMTAPSFILSPVSLTEYPS